MAFIKIGDAQPILNVTKGTEEDDEKAREAMKIAIQEAKKIEKDGNKIESKLESLINE